MDNPIPEPPLGTVVRTSKGYQFKRDRNEDGPRWSLQDSHPGYVHVSWEHLCNAYGTPTVIADEARTVVPSAFYDDLNRDLVDPQWRHAFDTNQAHLETIDMVTNLVGGAYRLVPATRCVYLVCTRCTAQGRSGEIARHNEDHIDPVAIVARVLRHNLEHHS